MILLAVLPFNTASNIKINSKSLRLDYLEHFIAFAIAGLLNVFKEQNTFRKESMIVIFKWFIGLIFFALILEFIQIIVPSRTLNIKDFLFNVYGLFAGTIFSLTYISLKKFLLTDKKERTL